MRCLATRILITTFFLIYSVNLWAVNPLVVNKNNRAVDRLEKDQLMDGYKEILEALNEAPFEPAIHYNLAEVFDRMGQTQKSLQEYVSVSEKATDDELKFFSLFNAATILGFAKENEIKNLDKAIEFYQKALKIKPDSKEVKTNIELLLQMKQGGGGGGSSQDQKDQDSKQNQGDGGQPPPQQKQQQPKQKQQPKKFDSKELTEPEVKKMLDEIKRQEEGVRAKMNEKKKEKPNGKDW